MMRIGTNLRLARVAVVLLVSAWVVAASAAASKAQTLALETKRLWLLDPVSAPRVQHRTFESDAVKTNVSYHIYTPEVYDKETDRRFPVLYWLHGSGGGLKGVPPLSAYFDGAIRAGKIPPMLIVFPNGCTDSMWCDSKDGRVPMEKVTVELLSHVDNTFRTIATREGRIIEGFSMGGYGAARLGFKHHDLFAAVSMLAGGPLDLEFKGPRAAANPAERERILQSVFGGDMEYYKSQSPWVLVEQNAAQVRDKTRVRVVVGERDFTAELNRNFHDHMTRLGIAHEFVSPRGVGHDTMALLGALGESNWKFYRLAFGNEAKPVEPSKVNAASSTRPILGAVTSAYSSTPIHNDTVWKDDRGEEIMCQGGNLCKFGDTFYFYSWADYPGDNRKDTITCYSSRDLASWKFERHIYTRDMTDLTLIVPDRLHVIYNAATKKYVMIGKHILPVDDPPIPGQPRVTGGVSFFTSDMPAGTFKYLDHEMLPAGASPGTDYHRDLAAFQDDDGTAYVVSSHDQHKPSRNIMITRLKPDYLKVDRAICEIPLTGVAREAPHIIKLKSRYWLFVSGHGVGGSAWNGSPTSYTTAEKLEGPWTPFKVVECEPASKDCFNAQTDFLFEVRGTAGSCVLWGGDRWSQRTKLGIGKNVWLPLQWKDDQPLLKWFPIWNVDVVAGTWMADQTAPGTPPANTTRPATQPTVGVPAAPDTTSAASLMPRITGDWWTVAGNPDLGDLTDPKQQPVDFSIWQAADGTWQLWSCIRNTKVGGRTRLFHRWEGKQLTDTDWKPMGIALRADPNCGEESVQSPHVIKDGGVYHMFYGDWNHICHATSQDGKTFTRVVGSDGKTAIFGEGAGEFTRDPMVLKIGETYYCYYCANPEGGKGTGKGVVFCRTSPDLKTWSASKRVAYGGAAGTGWTSAECPFVLPHDGWYYLFRTQSYGQGAQSRVYRSQDPMDFGINDDRFHVGTLPVAAPEIIGCDGQTYMASLLPSLQGIRIARLGWESTKKEVR